MAENQYSLSEEEKQAYRGLLKSAFDSANQFTGSEETYENLMASLIAMEKFVVERNEGKPSEDVEKNFAFQIGSLSNQFNTVSGLLGHASNLVYGMLSRLKDLKEVLNALALGGAHIDYSSLIYVLTDEQFPSGDGELDRNLTEFRKQPRLAILAKELQTIGIFTDDLILRVGKVFEEKVRKLPYIIVEIPRLGKQVAVCDQYGETTFVSQSILSPYVWASHSKKQLKALEGVKAVSFDDGWPFKVCNLLKYGTDQMTPDEYKPGRKVDVQNILKSNHSPIKLTEDMIENHILLYFMAYNGRWPTQKSGKVEMLPGETWSGLNAALGKKSRGLPGGQSLYTMSVRFTIREAANYYKKFGE